MVTPNSRLAYNKVMFNLANNPIIYVVVAVYLVYGTYRVIKLALNRKVTTDEKNRIVRNTIAQIFNRYDSEGKFDRIKPHANLMISVGLILLIGSLLLYGILDESGNNENLREIFILISMLDMLLVGFGFVFKDLNRK